VFEKVPVVKSTVVRRRQQKPPAGRVVIDGDAIPPSVASDLQE